MYDTLRKLAVRPEPHASMTIAGLWTRPHIARQMLAHHLDQDTALASRPWVEIEGIVDWLDGELGLAGKRLCDLGCGPGLYAQAFASRGAQVTGVDFSPVAIDHARSRAATAGSRIDYRLADYLHDDLGTGFDLVTLIYYDYCALSPAQRGDLLRRIRHMLRPGGQLVMDVVAADAFEAIQEQLSIGERLMDGFWSASDYVGIHRTWLYRAQSLSLDHFAIVEPDSHWEILNWMQYFTADRLVEELEEGGFDLRSLTGSLAGEPLCDGGREIGVIAERRPGASAAGAR